METSHHEDQEPPGGAFFWLFHALVSLSKYRRALVCFSLSALAAAVMLVPKLPLGYKSVAVIQVRKSLTTAMNESLGLKPTEAAGQVSEDYRVVQTGMLESGLLHADVGEQLLQRGYLEPSDSMRGQLRQLVLALISNGAEEQLVDHAVLHGRRLIDAGNFVAAGLSVRRGHKSPKIELTFKDGDPERAQAALRILLEQYRSGLEELYDIEPVFDAAVVGHDAANTFWRDEKAKFDDYSSEHGLYDPTRQIAEASAGLTRTLNLITAERLSLEAARSRALALNLARTEIPGEFETAPTRFENRYRWVVLDLLTAARKRLLDSPFSEGAPEYLALLEPVDKLILELDSLPAQLVEANPAAPNSSYFKLMSDLARARGDIAAGEASLGILDLREAQQRSELATLEASAPGFLEFKRALNSALAGLEDKRAHVDKLQRVRDLGAADLLWSFKVLQSPNLPIGPSGPGRSLQLIAVCLLGIGLSFLAALVLGLTDRSVREPRELERLFGVKPLAAFPDLAGRRELGRLLENLGFGFSRFWRARRLAKDGNGLRDFSKMGPLSLVVQGRVDALIGALGEAVPESDAPRILTLSGVHKGAGVTTLAGNLARRLGEREGGVLLALRRDGDFSLESVEDWDGVDLFMYNDVLLDGKAAREGGLRGWASALGSRYRTIIVDAPPVLGSCDALCMLSGSDISLLVARGDVTSRSALREAATAIEASDAGQVGVILNAYHDHLPACLSCA